MPKRGRWMAGPFVTRAPFVPFRWAPSAQASVERQLPQHVARDLGELRKRQELRRAKATRQKSEAHDATATEGNQQGITEPPETTSTSEPPSRRLEDRRSASGGTAASSASATSPASIRASPNHQRGAVSTARPVAVLPAPTLLRLACSRVGRSLPTTTSSHRAVACRGARARARAQVLDQKTFGGGRIAIHAHGKPCRCRSAATAPSARDLSGARDCEPRTRTPKRRVPTRSVHASSTRPGRAGRVSMAAQPGSARAAFHAAIGVHHHTTSADPPRAPSLRS